MDLFRTVLKRVFFMGAATVMATGAILAQSTEPSNSPASLAGTWLATVTFQDNSTVKVLFSFNGGTGDEEGTLIDQNNYQYTPNPICTADQGVWRRSGFRQYIATHYAFCFDADQGYIPDGSVRVRDEIDLNRAGTAFTGRQHIEIYDVDGNLILTVDATMVGNKIHAEAPPPAGPAATGVNPNLQKLMRIGLQTH